LVVFQPTHEAAKRAAAPLLLSALESATVLDKSLTDRASQLEHVGRLAPIAVGKGASTVMIESAMERDRIVLDEGGYRSRRSGQPWTMERLRLVAEQEPQRLSANVLLRPVVEAALLPTLAYVAGPGELAYIPQAKPLYEALQVSPQATIPRWSARVVEGRVAKILTKFGVTVEDLAAPEGQLEASLVRDDIPEGAAAAIASIRSVLEQDYEQLATAVGQVDVTLEKPVRASRQNSLRSLADIEKRLISHLKKQNATVVQQLEKARRNLLPLGIPQERVLNVVPFLVRYGEAFLKLAVESCEEWVAPLETGSSDT
jgi:bacillithiol biosynthesis cysteine-adding enzyme BshC